MAFVAGICCAGILIILVDGAVAQGPQHLIPMIMTATLSVGQMVMRAILSMVGF
jgi:hypothetical protein